MVELSKVIGTLLKELAQSRVISDFFSRNVSIDYEEDPLLRLFPVPRMEIKEVTISLPFAIKSTNIPTTTIEEVLKPLVKSEAAKLSDLLYDCIILKHRNKAKILALKDESFFIKNFTKTFEQTLMANTDIIEIAVEGESGKLSEILTNALRDELFRESEIRSELLVGTDEANFVKRIGRPIHTYIKKDFMDNAKSAINSAQERATIVDIAVTTSELSEVSESSITRITLAAEVSNYQWTKIDEVNGKPIRKLVPE